MIIGIYGAGQFCANVNREIPFIAVDGGILSLNRLNIQPKYIIGDFDSADFSIVENLDNVTKLPCRKDYTDTEVAIIEAIELGYDELELYGVTGGRLDHFFAICRLLKKYENISIRIIDDINIISLLRKGKSYIYKNNYDYISFFSTIDTTVSIKNVAYPLCNYMLRYQDPLCVSNEIIKEPCIVECSEPIFCIQSKK